MEDEVDSFLVSHESLVEIITSISYSSSGLPDRLFIEIQVLPSFYERGIVAHH